MSKRLQPSDIKDGSKQTSNAEAAELRRNTIGSRPVTGTAPFGFDLIVVEGFALCV